MKMWIKLTGFIDIIAVDNFSIISVRSGCPYGDLYKNSSGQIEFYHSTEEDPSGFVCSWTIQAEENKVIEIEITDITIRIN